MANPEYENYSSGPSKSPQDLVDHLEERVAQLKEAYGAVEQQVKDAESSLNATYGALQEAVKILAFARNLLPPAASQ